MIGLQKKFALALEKLKKKVKGYFSGEIEPIQIVETIMSGIFGDLENLWITLLLTQNIISNRGFKRIDHLKKLYPLSHKITHNIKTQQVIEKISERLQWKILLYLQVKNHQMMTAQFYRWTPVKWYQGSRTGGWRALRKLFACLWKWLYVMVDHLTWLRMSFATAAEYDIPIKIQLWMIQGSKVYVCKNYSLIRIYLNNKL